MSDTRDLVTKTQLAKICVTDKEFGNFFATIRYGFRSPDQSGMYPIRANEVVVHTGEIVVVIDSVEIKSSDLLFEEEDLAVGFFGRIGENIIVDENGKAVKLDPNIKPQGGWVIKNKKNGNFFSQNPDDRYTWAFNQALEPGQEPTQEQLEAGFQKTSETTGLFQCVFYILIRDEAIERFNKVQQMAKQMFENQSNQSTDRGVTRSGVMRGGEGVTRSGAMRGGEGVTRSGAMRGGGGVTQPVFKSRAEFIQNAALACAVKGREHTTKYTSFRGTFVEGSLNAFTTRVYITIEDDINTAAKKIFGLDQEEEDVLPPVFKSG